MRCSTPSKAYRSLLCKLQVYNVSRFSQYQRDIQPSWQTIMSLRLASFVALLLPIISVATAAPLVVNTPYVRHEQYLPCTKFSHPQGIGHAVCTDRFDLVGGRAWVASPRLSATYHIFHLLIFLIALFSVVRFLMRLYDCSRMNLSSP